MLPHCFQPLFLQQSNCTRSYFGFFTPIVRKVKHGRTMCNEHVQSNRCHRYVFFFYFFGLCCVSVQQLGQLFFNDDVGLSPSGNARFKFPHLQTMTFVTQHKPIEGSTDMVFMTKKILNSNLASKTEKPVWAAHDFKICSCRTESRRPGTHDDTNATQCWTTLLRIERFHWPIKNET